MRSDFLENSISIKDIPKECPVDLFLIENNEKQISQICDFFQDETKLLLLNGFKGTGKSNVIEFTCQYLCHEVLILPYNCLETTILDDMLLSFFNIFRNYTIQGKIVPPRIKTENFTQKINSYFNSIEKPIVIVLNSFEAVLKSNKSDILNFIKHLSKLPNVKIIISSRVFVYEEFEEIKYSRVTCLAYTQQVFEKYLRANGIKNIGLLSNELYKHSKGYPWYVNLAVKIINLRNLTLVQFLENYSKSYMPFNEFIFREALALVDPVSAHLFRLLTVMRIPIHVNLLRSLHLFNEERVFFFVTNSILSIDGECLYLKDSFREIIENQIPENVMVKLHSACVDLYNTQLPLKPLERDLKLSRQTMRNEIEYHSMFIPRKPVLTSQNVKLIEVNPVIETPQEIVETTPQPVEEETREEKINKISFIIEDESILDNIANSINDFINEKVQINEFEEQNNKLGLTQLLNQAKQEEDKYNYKYAIMLYQNALTKKDDDNFYKFLPTIYIKLAQCYKNLSQWYEALEAYTQAQDFYFNASDINKISEIKLEIANIYYIIYKHDNAKYILTELENSQNLSNELRIKVNLALAKLSDNLNVEYSYYKKSLNLIEIGTNKSIIAELYYKFAGINDEKNNTKSAAEYYKKCIEIDSNPLHNKYIARALANLAELYDEAGSSKHAIKYYNESIKIDTAMKNFNGLYSSAVHLAEIYAHQDEAKSLDYLKQSLAYAKELKEPFYIAEASILLGDFYNVRKDYEKAYKYFINAYSVAKHSFSKDNIERIQSRINDIKHRLTEENFTQLQDKYGK